MNKDDYNSHPFSTPIRQNILRAALHKIIKNFSARYVWLSLFVLTVVIIALWTAPRVISLYYEEKGGKLLDEALSSDGGEISAFNCIQSPLTNNTFLEKVNKSILILKIAVQYSHPPSHAYVLLGRAYCALEQPQNAIVEYRKYVSIRPNDPLGHMELGFAYLLSCETQNKINNRNIGLMTSSHNNVCDTTEYQTRITEEWNKQGIGTDALYREGDNAFDQKEYQNAVSWYQAGNILGQKLSQSQAFKWIVASVLTGYPIPLYTDSQSIVIHSLKGSLQIEARNLQWMNDFPHWNVHYGDLLRKFPGHDQNAGILWWAGTAVAFVNVSEPGDYHITLRAKDTPPGPIQLQIEDNLSPVHLFILQKGDNTWNNLEQEVYLTTGIHLIGIHYLQDTGDATIDYIRLEINTSK